MMHDRDSGIVSRRQAVALGGAAAVGALLRSRGASAQEGTPVATPSECPALTLDEEKAIARQFFTAWENVVQNPSELAALLAPGYIHHWRLEVDSVGADESIARITAYMQAIPDQRFTIHAVYGENDVVIVRWTATGTQSGDLGSISAPNASAELSGINIMRFECGVIAESWIEVDQLGRLMQLGVVTEDELGTIGTPTP